MPSVVNARRVGQALSRVPQSGPEGSSGLLTVVDNKLIVDNRQATVPGSFDRQLERPMEFESKPKFVTFDMNGTLIKFSINDAMREVLGDRLPAEVADDYLRICKAYRIDECTGAYQPFHQVVARSMERAS